MSLHHINEAKKFLDQFINERADRYMKGEHVSDSELNQLRTQMLLEFGLTEEEINTLILDGFKNTTEHLIETLEKHRNEDHIIDITNAAIKITRLKPEGYKLLRELITKSAKENGMDLQLLQSLLEFWVEIEKARNQMYDAALKFNRLYRKGSIF